MLFRIIITVKSKDELNVDRFVFAVFAEVCAVDAAVVAESAVDCAVFILFCVIVSNALNVTVPFKSILLADIVIASAD